MCQLNLNLRRYISMMRRHLCSYLIPLAFLMAATASHSSTTQLDYTEKFLYDPVARIVTPEGRVRVVVTKPRTKIQLARVQQPIARLVLEDDDTDYYDEIPDLQIGYRRPELVNQTADVGLSDEIKIRLALARIKAMQAYHQNWS